MDHAANTYDLYADIQQRTGGEIYIGVLGPVRTGKSTFIKRFMDEMVLPNMEDVHARTRAQDELPQSAGGRTITTTEPKFVPSEAANITLDGDTQVNVRLIDCVGYMVEGAVGHLEEDAERMVKTPWFDYEIPFSRAAEIGTDKVMQDHSTIGLVITTDGSFSEIEREHYVEAEERTILALKQCGKPFLVLVNSLHPYSEETRRLTDELCVKYDVSAMAVNCEQLRYDDIRKILEKVLYEFPISAMEFYLPKWVEMLPAENVLKQDMIGCIRGLMGDYQTMRNLVENPINLENEYINKSKLDNMRLNDGVVEVSLEVDDRYYYGMLTEMVGTQIEDEYQLVETLREFADRKREYEQVRDAVEMVRAKGYGVVMPKRDEIVLATPEVIRHGNKYGVKIKAMSPSIHMIRANIETEIAPIVGTKEQADDLIDYIKQAESRDGIWETNIFGKTIEGLVNDGIASKVTLIGEDSQVKLQDTMQKIVNDSNGGMVCIII